MAKQLLKERFQQLAGLKPLYGLNESSDAYDAWQSTLSKIYLANRIWISKEFSKNIELALFPLYNPQTSTKVA